MTTVSFNAKGITLVEKALRSLTPMGKRANWSALLGTADDARLNVARELAEAKNLPVRIVKNRIRVYRFERLEGGAGSSHRPARVKLWVGTRDGIGAKEHPAVAKRLAKFGSFEATMPNGHTGQFIRRRPGKRWVGHGKSGGIGYRFRNKGGVMQRRPRPKTSSPNLPIIKPKVFLWPDAEKILPIEVKRSLKKVYPKIYRKAFLREIKRLVTPKSTAFRRK